MLNTEIGSLFDELADLLELQGANSFRIRAYRNAARTVADLTESVEDLVDDPDRSLTELPGIGKDLADKIKTIVHTGTLPQLLELRTEFPTGVLDMLKLPGLGPKKAALLFKQLGISTLMMLQAAAEAGEIAKIKGFGKKTEQTILEGLQHLAEVGSRVFLAEAKALADYVVRDLQQLPSVLQIETAGSLRRRRESVADIDLLVAACDSAPAMELLSQHPLVSKILVRGETKQSVILRHGPQLDLRVVPEESYGAALQYFTGSKEHNIVIRRRAIDRGLKLNEYGVYRDEQRIAGATEEEVYAAVDLPWIPPELRENRGEIDLAEQGRLPKLVELEDIRGDLHMHTTATDGTASIGEMISAAQERGLKYIAITDHSKRVTMANGLDADRLRAHWREIEKVAQEFRGIEVLRGIECDILENATLDLPDDVLAEADFVIAVLHYGLKQPKEQIHRRLLTAIESPYVSMIGHLTGRLIGRRQGAQLDRDFILKACADHGVMLEINAHPSRLDIDDVTAAAARERGIPIVINTDAHSQGGLDVMQYGVFQARRGGLEAKHVANTRTCREFRKLLRNG